MVEKTQLTVFITVIFQFIHISEAELLVNPCLKNEIEYKDKLPKLNIWFNDNNITTITEKTERNLSVEIPCSFSGYLGNNELRLQAFICDSMVASVLEEDSSLVVNDGLGNGSCNYTFTLQGHFLGKSLLNISLVELNADGEVVGWRHIDDTHQVNVIRQKYAIDDIFTASVSVLVVLNTIGCGCAMEVDLLKRYLKRPLPLLIGFASQFGFMPALAYAMLYLLPISKELALGLMALGCSPGGGSSNMYTILVEGDISLSITMTFINTLGALGMMPLWLQLTASRGGVPIPVLNIVTSLALLIVPAIMGLLIRRFKPNIADKIQVALKPFSLIIVIYICVLGLIANFYIFTLLQNPWVLVAGAVVTFTGFFLSGALTAIFCYKWKIVKTVMIETAIQNAGIAIVIIKFALPQPDADLASIMPISANIFAPIPIWIYFIIIMIYRKGFHRAKDADITNVKERSQCAEKMANGLKQDDGTIDTNGNISKRHSAGTSQLTLVNADELFTVESGLPLQTFDEKQKL